MHFLSTYLRLDDHALSVYLRGSGSPHLPAFRFCLPAWHTALSVYLHGRPRFLSQALQLRPLTAPNCAQSILQTAAPSSTAWQGQALTVPLLPLVRL